MTGQTRLTRWGGTRPRVRRCGGLPIGGAIAHAFCDASRLLAVTASHIEQSRAACYWATKLVAESRQLRRRKQ